MKTTEIRVKNIGSNYSIVIGENILEILSKRIKYLCPKA